VGETKKNILILENGSYIWSSVKDALEKDYNVTTTNTLEKIGKTPDLILTKVESSNFFRQIRETKIACLNLLLDYISPNDLERLVRRINYLLGNIEIRKEIQENRSLLITFPRVDYDTIVLDTISQLKSEKICYLTLNKTYEAMKDLLRTRIPKIKNIIFIDGITRTVIETKNKKDCYFVSSPGALGEILKVLESLSFRYLIFDSLTDLFTYREIEEVERFVKNVTDILVRKEEKGIFYAVTRYKRAPDISTLGRETLIEEQISSFDKTIDLRKGLLNFPEEETV
jgi:hypothetical protein